MQLQGAYSADNVCAVLKHVLEEMFCTLVVDESKLDRCLDDPARYRHGNMLLTCFTIAGEDTNVCWRIEGPYDCYFDMSNLSRSVISPSLLHEAVHEEAEVLC